MTTDRATEGAAATLARSEIRAIAAEKGHAVEIARRAVERLELAFDSGALRRTPALDAILADLSVALEPDEGGKVGGKSPEAARFILRALDRALDEA